MTGSVRMYDQSRQFGFIRTDAGSSIFFHLRQWGLTIPDEKPAEGLRVSFEVEQSERGPRAINLSRV